MRINRTLPKNKERLFIIVEGMADKEFINALLNSDYLNLNYKVIPVNAYGHGNLLDKLKSIKSTHPISTVLIFLDLDGKGIKRLHDIRHQINVRGLRKFISSTKGIYFVNPMIEYLFLVAKKDCHPKIFTKDQYKPYIQDNYKIDNYRCTTEQIELMIKELVDNKFEILFCNLNKINKDPNELPSSDLLDLINYLKQ